MVIRKRTEHESPVGGALTLEECIAKTRHSADGTVLKGMPVEDHCKIVGLVARELMHRCKIPEHEQLFPPGAELVAAVHDIGKINPHFQSKLYSASGINPSSIAGISNGRPELERQFGYHAGVSQAALEGVDPYIPVIAGKHHGASPQILALKTDENIGGSSWQNVREECISRLKEFFSTDWPDIHGDIHANLLAGLTTVADWIGSGSNFADLSKVPETGIEQIIADSVDLAGFITPKFIPGLSFSEVFSGFSPRPFQEQLIRMVDGPGVYIVEALMGEGKTEAALYAAYSLISKGDASGIYFALPTRLTSEKIFERMNAFLMRILADDERHKTLLLHADSWLYETDLGEDARPGYSWFDSNKRGLLAPFAVGTIDQALMAVMNVRHGFVRSFGLAGKVVILDEIHSYDAYTGLILEKLIAALRSLGASVILLSATLTDARKNELVPGIESESPEDASPYPLISKLSASKQSQYSQEMKGRHKEIKISTTARVHDAFEHVYRKASDGQYVLWIENTVSEAQEVFRRMAVWGKENGVDVGLVHSRFPRNIRREKESRWVAEFGKNRNALADGSGKILIGTQVLEQSLDIDADFLVSRLAPSDMLLQRMGRLWRHEENNPFRAEAPYPSALIITPEPDKLHGSLEHAFGPSGFVYAPYILMRSMDVISSHESISIPGDLRKLIGNTYEDISGEPQNYRAAKNLLMKEREKLQRFALLGIASKGQTLSESASTRYSDLVYCDVLLLRSEPGHSAGNLVFLDGTELELPSPPISSPAEKKRIARKINEQLISVPSYLSPEPLPVSDLGWISPYIYVSENAEDRIRVAVLDPEGQIRGFNQRQANNTYKLSYSSFLGYSSQKKET